MLTIYADDFAQTAMPRMDSDGAIEIYWNHPEFLGQWSEKHCDEFPYVSWTAVAPLSKSEERCGAWSPREIILMHFGLYEKGVRINWPDLLSMTPNDLEELKGEVANQFYQDDMIDRSPLLLVESFHEISLELIEYFGRNPSQLQILDWRKFELLLNSIFKNQGFETELGPGSGDAGIDLRLIHKDTIGSVLTLVQAKKWHSGHPVHLEAVAALYGVVEAHGANRGLLVTTSRFLPSAQRFAEKQSYRLSLAGPIEVAQWCKQVVQKYR